MHMLNSIKKGQFFTHANLASKMIAAVPNGLWGKPVLEPACGDIDHI